jgi:hypothetical protein
MIASGFQRWSARLKTRPTYSTMSHISQFIESQPSTPLLSTHTICMDNFHSAFSVQSHRFCGCASADSCKRRHMFAQRTQVVLLKPCIVRTPLSNAASTTSSTHNCVPVLCATVRIGAAGGQRSARQSPTKVTMIHAGADGSDCGPLCRVI